MEIQKLNCPSCGAPITIPEDLDQFNCASCGSALAVKRGEGYVALKMVEKVAQVIQQSGKDTQSAIREGSEVTRKELQRLQITQEISMMEMSLTSQSAEIRGLQRGLQNATIAAQIRSLHIQEYNLLDKIRTLRGQLAQVEYKNPNERQDFVENQLSYVRAEIAALKSAAPLQSEGKQYLNRLNVVENQLLKNIQALKIRAMEASLLSFRPGADGDSSQEGSIHRMDDINQDLAALKTMPKSPEREAVEGELQQNYKNVRIQWEKLEDARVLGSLESTGIQYAPDDVDSLRDQYLKVQNDLKKLGGMQSNQVIERHKKSLQDQSIKIFNRIQKQQRQAEKMERAPSPGAGAVAGFGLGAILGSLTGVFHKQPTGIGLVGNLSSEAAAIPSSEVQGQAVELQPSTEGLGQSIELQHTSDALEQSIELPSLPVPRARTPYLKGLALAVVSLVIFFCIGFSIYSALYKGSQSTTLASIPLFGLFVGYIIGSYMLFHTISPGVRFLPPWSKIDVSQNSFLKGTSRSRIGLFTGIDVFVGAVLLELCFIVALPSNSNMVSCFILMPLGLVLAFVVGRNVGKQVNG